MKNNTTTTTTEIKSAKAYGRGEYDEHTILRIKGTYHRLAVSFVAPGEVARREYNGPMTVGPWAETFGVCAVLSGSRDTLRQSEALRTVEVSEGDVIEVEGIRFEVKIDRGQFINLKNL